MLRRRPRVGGTRPLTGQPGAVLPVGRPPQPPLPPGVIQGRPGDPEPLGRPVDAHLDGELGERPATVKEQRAWRQAVARIEQYRERYRSPTPTARLAPDRRHADLEQRRHPRATCDAVERCQARQHAHREQRIDRRERADRPLTRPARADR